MCGFDELLQKTRACFKSSVSSDAIRKTKNIVSGRSRFKIGKTGQNLDDRFDSEYKDKYDQIERVYSSSQKKEIDELEKNLIDYFRNSDEYSCKCDNEQEGGGDMESDSNIYYVYVVIKK